MSVNRTRGEQRGTYYVLCLGGDAPRRPHYSRAKAMGEAQRLAAKYSGVEFLVVKVKDGFRAALPPQPPIAE